MSDLVETLRNPAFYVPEGTPAKDKLLVLIHGMEGLCRVAANRIELLENGFTAIKKNTLNGDMGVDVAWFDQIETLHDFCERMLTVRPEDGK